MCAQRKNITQSTLFLLIKNIYDFVDFVDWNEEREEKLYAHFAVIDVAHFLNRYFFHLCFLRVL